VFAELRYFNMLFTSPALSQILMNTFTISFMKYIMLFHGFVIFVILLNEIRFNLFQKYYRSFPICHHFLSWVVIAGIGTIITLLIITSTSEKRCKIHWYTGAIYNTVLFWISNDMQETPDKLGKRYISAFTNYLF
jgi:ABC-type polysaccharide transport system permease subunit